MAGKVREQKLQSVHEVKTSKDRARVQMNESKRQQEMELKARNK